MERRYWDYGEVVNETSQVDINRNMAFYKKAIYQKEGSKIKLPIEYIKFLPLEGLHLDTDGSTLNKGKSNISNLGYMLQNAKSITGTSIITESGERLYIYKTFLDVYLENLFHGENNTRIRNGFKKSIQYTMDRKDINDKEKARIIKDYNVKLQSHEEIELKYINFQEKLGGYKFRCETPLSSFKESGDERRDNRRIFTFEEIIDILERLVDNTYFDIKEVKLSYKPAPIEPVVYETVKETVKLKTTPIITEEQKEESLSEMLEKDDETVKVIKRFKPSSRWLKETKKEADACYNKKGQYRIFDKPVVVTDTLLGLFSKVKNIKKQVLNIRKNDNIPTFADIEQKKLNKKGKVKTKIATKSIGGSIKNNLK